VHLDIYQLAETKNYLEQFLASINKSKKIVVYGSWIMDLIFCGVLCIPYEKIIAWVDPENPEVSNYKYFYHLPQLSLKKLQNYEYDTIISLKPRALSTPRIIEKCGLKARCRIINLLPDILNTDIAEALRGKKIALVGASDTVQKAKELMESEKRMGRIDYFHDMPDVYNNVSRKYDFVVFDKGEYGIDRREFAQNSRYQIKEILHPEFLCDGGFYARC
jgi:hypothetical protein